MIKQDNNFVFLGGTCNGSKWRDKLIQLLNKTFYNPVVENWTAECQQEEIRQREICEYCLYCITPKMTGVYSVAEVVDDSNKKPQKTILCILKDDEENSFTDSQYKSLVSVCNLIKRNGGNIFYSLEETAQFLNNK